jgi:hypothetical protein
MCLEPLDTMHPAPVRVIALALSPLFEVFRIDGKTCRIRPIVNCISFIETVYTVIPEDNSVHISCCSPMSVSQRQVI